MKVYLYRLDQVHDCLWRVRVKRFRFKLLARLYAAIASTWWDKVEVTVDD